MSASSFFYELAGRVIRLRRALIVLVLLLTAFFFWQMQFLRFDNSNEIWFSESDPALKRLNDFQAIFGNDDFVYVLFDGERLFKKDMLRTYTNLARDFRAHVPYLRSVTWLGNAEHITADAEGITVSDFIDPDGPYAPEAELRQRALREKPYLNNFISHDGATAGMLLELTAYPTGVLDPRSEVAVKVREVLSLPQYASLGVHVVGQPILHTDYNEISFRESALFFGLCLLLQMIVLYRIGRSVRDAVAPMLIVVLSVIWTMGMIQVLGYTLNLFIILVPVLLTCVCIGDSVHIIAFFRQRRRENMGPVKALRQAMADSGVPCLYTSLTTIAGFLSFFAADIRPFQEMGIYASLGVASAFLLSVIVVLIMYSMFQPGAPHTPAAGDACLRRDTRPLKKPDVFDRILAGIWRINVAHPKKILLGVAFLSLVCLFGYSKVQVETNTARMLSPDLPLRQSYDYADQRMGGAMSVEIMLDTGKADGIKEPEFLRAMERFQDRLENEKLVTKTISLLDILKKISEAMHDGDVAFHILPDKKEVIAQYLLLYEMSNGKELDKMISFDSRIARLTAKTQTLDTRQVRELTGKIAGFSEDFANGVSVSVTGSLDWTRSMNDLLAKGQRQSFLAALVSVSILMCLALRSLRLGLLSMVPNVLPVLATLGLMGLTGIYMDMPLMSFSAIMIGVVVDDTTHFLFHFKEDFERTGSYTQALHDTLTSAGRPLLFTTLTLFCGFAMLLFSNVIGVVKFGGLGCFAFALALAADFFVMPAILLTFRPLKTKQKAEQICVVSTEARRIYHE